MVFGGCSGGSSRSTKLIFDVIVNFSRISGAIETESFKANRNIS